MLIIKIILAVIVIIVISMIFIIGLLKFLIGIVCENIINGLNEKPLFEIFGIKIGSLNIGDLRKRNSDKIKVNKIKHPDGENETWTIDLP